MNMRLTEVVKNLLIINGIFFLATLSFQDFMVEKFALWFPGTEYFMIHQLVTHMFMHGGFGHIFGNMFALFIFGPMLEMRMGSKRFLTYYMITGLGAASLHLGVKYIELMPFINSLGADTFWGFLHNPNNYQQTAQLVDLYQTVYSPTLGASGAIFGILLAFGMLFPNVTIYLYFALPIKAKHFVMLYGAFELYMGLQNHPGDNVAHFAHLGGMLFGFFLLRTWRRNNLL
ncbi:rhomboid family intramembrane serine protease [bacterium]|nr:rhomboid family intramembrane serine protease [bacterium]